MAAVSASSSEPAITSANRWSLLPKWLKVVTYGCGHPRSTGAPGGDAFLHGPGAGGARADRGGDQAGRGPGIGRVYAGAAEHFSETELAELIWAIAVINTWNRLGATARPWLLA
jgi:hypothetical protein